MRPVMKHSLFAATKCTQILDLFTDYEYIGRWYFGDINRDTANQILNERVDSGTFLVRDSSTMPGEYVLCVRSVYIVSTSS